MELLGAQGSGRGHLGHKVLASFEEPKGEFVGTIGDVKWDKDHPGDELTWCVVYDDGTREQWNERQIKDGRKAYDQREENLKLNKELQELRESLAGREIVQQALEGPNADNA